MDLASSRVWVDGAGEAMDLQYHGNYEIWGGDIDPAAVQIARENAEKAEVEEIVRFFSPMPEPFPERSLMDESSAIRPMENG